MNLKMKLAWAAVVAFQVGCASAPPIAGSKSAISSVRNVSSRAPAQEGVTMMRFNHPLISVKGLDGGTSATPEWVMQASNQLPLEYSPENARIFCLGRDYDDFSPEDTETEKLAAKGLVGTAVTIHSMLVGDTDPQFTTIGSSGHQFAEIISSITCVSKENKEGNL